jgi:hypothetical protein
MKSGASDPFGDTQDERSESVDESSEGSADERSESSETRTESDATRQRGSAHEGDRTEAADPADATETDDGEDDASGTNDAGFSRDELPLVLRRDRVKDERPEVHQLFVQRETHDRAVDAERALEDRLGVDLSRTDAREAIYLAGMAHLDDAEEILRTWGYDL